MDEKIEKLAKLGALYEMLYKCKELIQIDGVLNGARSEADGYITDAQNLAYEEMEKLKKDILE